MWPFLIIIALLLAVPAAAVIDFKRRNQSVNQPHVKPSDDDNFLVGDNRYSQFH